MKDTESEPLLIAGRMNFVHENGSISFIHGCTGKLVTTFGSNKGDGYLRIGIGGKSFYMHRLVAMAFLDDYTDELSVDHINGDKSDNTVENLRMATPSQQQLGHRHPSKGASSIYRGVSLVKSSGSYLAHIRHGGKQHHLGTFPTEVEAAKAYDKAAMANGYLPEALNFKPTEGGAI